MEPLSLLWRLATSVPPPRFPTVKYAGVLTPASPSRASRPSRPSAIQSEAEAEPKRGRGASTYAPWAQLLKRTFAVDVLAWPRCQGRMRPRWSRSAASSPLCPSAHRPAGRRLGRAWCCARRRWAPRSRRTGRDATAGDASAAPCEGARCGPDSARHHFASGLGRDAGGARGGVPITSGVGAAAGEIGLDLLTRTPRRFASLAYREGVSLNQLVASDAAEQLAALMTEQSLADRGARASGRRFAAALAKLPNVVPELPPRPQAKSRSGASKPKRAAAGGRGRRRARRAAPRRPVSRHARNA